MLTTAILCSWLLAIIVAYFLLVRWRRLVRVRRRVQVGVEPAAAAVAVQPEQEGRLSRWLALAGYRAPGSAGAFLLACVLCTMVGLSLALTAHATGIFERVLLLAQGLPAGTAEVLLPFLVAGPWILFALLALAPALVVRSKRRKRVLEIEQDLPINLDLMATLSESGLGFDAALAQILETEDDGRPLSDELRTFQLESLAGVPRIACFRRLADRCRVGSMTIFCSALVQAEQVGAGFAEVLNQQARDLRGRRRERAMILAQALPVKLVFPLVICFLPGIFLVTLGPAFMSFVEMANQVIRAR